MTLGCHVRCWIGNSVVVGVSVVYGVGCGGLCTLVYALLCIRLCCSVIHALMSRDLCCVRVKLLVVMLWGVEEHRAPEKLVYAAVSKRHTVFFSKRRKNNTATVAIRPRCLYRRRGAGPVPPGPGPAAPRVMGGRRPRPAPASSGPAHKPGSGFWLPAPNECRSRLSTPARALGRGATPSWMVGDAKLMLFKAGACLGRSARSAPGFGPVAEAQARGEACGQDLKRGKPPICAPRLASVPRWRWLPWLMLGMKYLSIYLSIYLKRGREGL